MWSDKCFPNSSLSKSTSWIFWITGLSYFNTGEDFHIEYLILNNCLFYNNWLTIHYPYFPHNLLRYKDSRIFDFETDSVLLYFDYIRCTPEFINKKVSSCWPLICLLSQTSISLCITHLFLVHHLYMRVADKKWSAMMCWRSAINFLL